MRQNFPGLLGYTLILIGFVGGGIWIIAMATSGTINALAPGIVSLVGFIGGFTLLLAIKRGVGTDPLEPPTTDEEAKVYEEKRDEDQPI